MAAQIEYSLDLKGLSTNDQYGEIGRDIVNSTLCDARLARLVVKSFNTAGGRRLVECTPTGWRSIRRSFGHTFSWASGFPADHATLTFVAFCIGNAVRSMFDAADGTSSSDAFRLPTSGDGLSILVPTTITSMRFGLDLYVRMDIQSEGRRLYLNRLYLTDENGGALCGLASIPDGIRDIAVAAKALHFLLGKYDVLRLNALIFDSWAIAHDQSRAAFSVDLPSDGDERVRMTFKRTSISGPWAVTFCLGEEEFPLASFAHDPDFSINPDKLEIIAHELREQVLRLPPDEVIHAVGLEHILDRLDRLGGFGELFNSSESAAYATTEFLSAIQESISRLRHQSEWMNSLGLYFGGQESDGLRRVGDVIDAIVQFQLPLFLTAEDRNRGIPTTVIVARARQSDENAETPVVFPTVLDPTMAEANHRRLRRAIHFGCRRSAA